MKIAYQFATETVAIEVTDDWGNILVDLDRDEHNNNRRETRRHYHLEACEYEGMDFASEDFSFDTMLDGDEAKRLVAAALSCLTDAQQNLIRALYFKELSAKDYAKQSGISDAAVSKMKKAALKKMKKVLLGG